jgi:hypothetical protein
MESALSMEFVMLNEVVKEGFTKKEFLWESKTWYFCGTMENEWTWNCQIWIQLWWT